MCRWDLNDLRSCFSLRLWIQHDNTVKELKNGLSGALLAYLCSSNYFWETAHCCLPVGHTHEDIGDLVAERENMKSYHDDDCIKNHF